MIPATSNASLQAVSSTPSNADQGQTSAAANARHPVELFAEACSYCNLTAQQVAFNQCVARFGGATVGLNRSVPPHQALEDLIQAASELKRLLRLEQYRLASIENRRQYKPYDRFMEAKRFLENATPASANPGSRQRQLELLANLRDNAETYMWNRYSYADIPKLLVSLDSYIEAIRYSGDSSIERVREIHADLMKNRSAPPRGTLHYLEQRRAGSATQETPPQTSSVPIGSGNAPAAIAVAVAPEPELPIDQKQQVDRLLRDLRHCDSFWLSGTPFTPPTKPLKELKRLLATTDSPLLRQYVLDGLIRHLPRASSQKFEYGHEKMVSRIYQRLLDPRSLGAKYHHFPYVAHLMDNADPRTGIAFEQLFSDKWLIQLLPELVRGKQFKTLKGRFINMVKLHLQRLRNGDPAIYFELLENLAAVDGREWYPHDERDYAAAILGELKWIEEQRQGLSRQVRADADASLVRVYAELLKNKRVATRSQTFIEQFKPYLERLRDDDQTAHFELLYALASINGTNWPDQSLTELVRTMFDELDWMEKQRKESSQQSQRSLVSGPQVFELERQVFENFMIRSWLREYRANCMHRLRRTLNHMRYEDPLAHIALLKEFAEINFVLPVPGGGEFHWAHADQQNLITMILDELAFLEKSVRDLEHHGAATHEAGDSTRQDLCERIDWFVDEILGCRSTCANVILGTPNFERLLPRPPVSSDAVLAHAPAPSYSAT